MSRLSRQRLEARLEGAAADELARVVRALRECRHPLADAGGAPSIEPADRDFGLHVAACVAPVSAYTPELTRAMVGREVAHAQTLLRRDPPADVRAACREAAMATLAAPDPGLPGHRTTPRLRTAARTVAAAPPPGTDTPPADVERLIGWVLEGADGWRARRRGEASGIAGIRAERVFRDALLVLRGLGRADLERLFEALSEPTDGHDRRGLLAHADAGPAFWRWAIARSPTPTEDLRALHRRPQLYRDPALRALIDAHPHPDLIEGLLGHWEREGRPHRYRARYRQLARRAPARALVLLATRPRPEPLQRDDCRPLLAAADPDVRADALAALARWPQAA